MLRNRPELSNAKLRDAELADAERKLREAREQLAAVQAEIARSCELLDAISLGSGASEAEAPRQEFDGAVAAFALGKRRKQNA